MGARHSSSKSSASNSASASAAAGGAAAKPNPKPQTTGLRAAALGKEIGLGSSKDLAALEAFLADVDLSEDEDDAVEEKSTLTGTPSVAPGSNPNS